jgi:hypothetical protein
MGVLYPGYREFSEICSRGMTVNSCKRSRHTDDARYWNLFHHSEGSTEIGTAMFPHEATHQQEH